MSTLPALKRLSALCAGAMLLACAGLPSALVQPDPAPWRDADAAYADGRTRHLAQQPEAARQAYQAALARDPAHVAARNGLATLHAERREWAAAIAIWRSVTETLAPGARPEDAYLFSNLGTALLLAGDLTQAVTALEQACLRDPLNARAWRQLGAALERQGDLARAQDMLRQAQTLEQHDLRADLAVAGGSTVPVLAAAARAPAGARHELVAGADGLLTLRRVPAQPVAPLAPAAPAPVAAPPLAAPARPEDAAPADQAGAALLEIRNGNGVTGMARALRRQMDDPAYRVVRLTNARRFNVRQTRVEFQGPHRAAAERLAGRFGHAGVVEVSTCAPSDLRLVIGRDLKPSPAAGPSRTMEKSG